MEITARTLREVEFREARKGYHPDDVDEFLEQVAVGVDELHERIRRLQGEVDDALRRLQEAEERLAAVPDGDDSVLSRAIILAQRTADQALADAKREGQGIVDAARSQAEAIVAEAEEDVRRMRTDAESRLRHEVERLGALRASLHSDLSELERHVEAERGRLQMVLSDLLRRVEGGLSVAPAPPSFEVGADAPTMTLDQANSASSDLTQQLSLEASEERTMLHPAALGDLEDDEGSVRRISSPSTSAYPGGSGIFDNQEPHLP
jgi:DivIVA domain-containing protein